MSTAEHVHGEMHGRVYARANKAWYFWPHDEVAILWDEPTLGCVAVIHRDGEAGHARLQPATLGGPWVEVRDGLWVHPAHARRVAATWGLPVPPQAAPLRGPRSAPMAGTKVRPDEVIEVVGGRQPGRWVTDRGEVPFTGSLGDALRLHGDIVRVGQRWINRRRVRCCDWSGARVRIVLDTGEAMRGGSVEDFANHLRRSLGLPRLPGGEGWTHAQRFAFGVELRDWPFELTRASATHLQDVGGGDARRLIVHALWQTVRWRALGRDVGSDNIRGYYYRVIAPIMNRAGMSKAVALIARVIGREYDSRERYQLLLVMLDVLISRHHLITFGDLGFADLHTDRRGVGAVRPDVIVLSEKTSIADTCRRLASRFGVSFALNDGQPHLELTERLAAEIPADLPLQVVAYVDYDHGGWIIADAFVKQLERYGRQATLAGHLVTPQRFSKRELSLYARPLSSEAPLERTKIRKWVQRSGGIAGKARGIHANHLLPYERVEEAFVDVTGLRPTRS